MYSSVKPQDAQRVDITLENLNPSAGTTAVRLFDKVKYYALKLGFVCQAPNRSKPEFPLLIVSTPSPVTGNIHACR